MAEKITIFSVYENKIKYIDVNNNTCFAWFVWIGFKFPGQILGRQAPVADFSFPPPYPRYFFQFRWLCFSWRRKTRQRICAKRIRNALFFFIFYYLSFFLCFWSTFSSDLFGIVRTQFFHAQYFIQFTPFDAFDLQCDKKVHRTFPLVFPEIPMNHERERKNLLSENKKKTTRTKTKKQNIHRRFLGWLENWNLDDGLVGTDLELNLLNQNFMKNISPAPLRGRDGVCSNLGLN